MKISVIASVGEGKTLLSAFDAALNNAGVSNYNLLVLSSIIPPNSVVKQIKKFVTPANEFGHKLYVVKAEMRSPDAKKFIAAGIGWYPLKDGSGLFVEHELTGDTKIAVKSEINFLIESSLEDLCDFRNIPFDVTRIKKVISLNQVKNKPACAMVIAVYQSEGWK